MTHHESSADRAVSTLATRRSGEGPHLALVHGFTQTGRSWRDVASDFESDHTVICVDLPGHGESATCRPPDLAGAALVVADAVGAASYVGYSMGGRICLQLTLDHPHLVDHLVLVGATPGIATEEERAQRRRADEDLAMRIDPFDGTRPAMALEQFLEDWLDNPIFADLTSSQRDLDARRANNAGGLAWALRHLGTGNQEPLDARLTDLSMPVLLVAGEYDEKFTAIATSMADAIGSNARVHIIDGARHAAPFSQPAQFIDAVRSFLDGRDHR